MSQASEQVSARMPGPRADDFDAFFSRELARATKLAWLLTRSAGAAEDITQDAMIAVHARFDRLDVPSAYLTRVIVNRSGRTARSTTSSTLAGN